MIYSSTYKWLIWKKKKPISQFLCILLYLVFCPIQGNINQTCWFINFRMAFICFCIYKICICVCIYILYICIHTYVCIHKYMYINIHIYSYSVWKRYFTHWTWETSVTYAGITPLLWRPIAALRPAILIKACVASSAATNSMTDHSWDSQWMVQPLLPLFPAMPSFLHHEVCVCLCGLLGAHNVLIIFLPAAG